MIYFYYGTDTEKARDKAKAVISAALKKHQDSTLIKIGEEILTQERVNELVGGQALFYNKFLVYFNKIFSDKTNKEVILKNIKTIGESENIFFFIEEKIDKTSLIKIEKVSEKVEEFIKKEKPLTKKQILAQKGEKIDFFEFTDALGRRDKKGLWTLFCDALEEVVPAEEVHGIFFWQIKSMILARRCKNAEEAGMNPYPFKKAQEYSRNFKEGELEKLSSKLVSVYHEAHRGNIDLNIALEKFILGL